MAGFGQQNWLITSKNDGLNAENIVEQQIHGKNKLLKNAGELFVYASLAPPRMTVRDLSALLLHVSFFTFHI